MGSLGDVITIRDVDAMIARYGNHSGSMSIAVGLPPASNSTFTGTPVSVVSVTVSDGFFGPVLRAAASSVTWTSRSLTDAISCSMPAEIAKGNELKRVTAAVTERTQALAATLRREGIR